MIATGNTFYFPWEETLMEWLQAHIPGVWISIISRFSLFGEELPLILILGFVYWSYDKKLGRTLGLSVIMGLAWNTMIKNVFLRRRPYFDLKGVKILRVVEPDADIYDISAQGFSFPSGHSTNSVTAFGSLAMNLRKRWMTVIAVLIPLLTGFSRCVVGAHFPTDVMVGWFLGFICVLLIHLLQDKVKNTFMLYGILLVSTIPGFFYCKSTDYFTAMGLMIGFMGGTLLDDHYVHFENTRKPAFVIGRVLVGLVVYLVFNFLLKKLFAGGLMSGTDTVALMMRFLRYAIVSFLGFGVYPMFFKYEKRIQSGLDA